jgi:hypothetical protein
MSATVAPAVTDRSDFRSVLIAGTKLGIVISVAVVAYLAVARYLPEGTAAVVEALLVLVGGTLAAFLPGQLAVARTIEGIAGAAGVGLWGALVFSIIDIALLRPFGAYPWTWDDVGGGSTWWYMPIWWMLATFLAWMGGVLVASGAARGRSSIMSVATPVLVGGVVLAALLRVAGFQAVLPVQAGLGFTVTLVALAALALTRKA